MANKGELPDLEEEWNRHQGGHFLGGLDVGLVFEKVLVFNGVVACVVETEPVRLFD